MEISWQGTEHVETDMICISNDLTKSSAYEHSLKNDHVMLGMTWSSK